MLCVPGINLGTGSQFPLFGWVRGCCKSHPYPHPHPHPGDRPDDDLLDWTRAPNIPGVPDSDEDDVFDRPPGDIRSIPRDGKPCDEEHPEMIWDRNPSGKVPGVPEEDDDVANHAAKSTPK